MEITRRAQRRVDRLLGIGTTRPVLAVAAFFAPFAITWFLFWCESDHFLVVLPCVSASFAATLLCIQLLGGNIVPFKWLLVVAFCCTVYAGQDWYVCVLLTVSVVLWLIVLDRYVGGFAPLFDPSSKQHRVFPITRLTHATDKGSI